MGPAVASSVVIVIGGYILFTPGPADRRGGDYPVRRHPLRTPGDAVERRDRVDASSTMGIRGDGTIERAKLPDVPRGS